ncbi:MAG: asparagine synthase (glutamine-hydrolyzing) [Sphingomonadaceae bacterium]|uniref:asparagine synthase (glutamine-hydrolyzing) n=1 Tax=Thermaurantiacus sp. TaxID=2820283 RepID=UPI00298F238C|nr:asparagine synthase (glutamine-hydrolyzing) [Thermaurantiacus sp.]MCS6986293.1 asparagine synthase (glutamine-hydrolyzing) [Sphingomonadaceae bacterium]MDW8415742.1 asparagine synthase (glutamine-hydrolyzing) [Thermaurantiacus sp.]
MCGLAGAFALSPEGRTTADELGAMAAALAHRGPDDQRCWVDAEGRAGLAHTRLAIVDREGGRQPMADPKGEVILAFTGEIFNFLELRAELTQKGHAFRTRSDTEVLLHAYLEWGEAAVERFNGQFAFAIVDRRGGRCRLVLARDHAGILPLFLAQDRGRLLFASEAKALLPALRSRPSLCPVALGQILALWAPVGDRTPFAGVRSLRPGHLLMAEHGALRERAWWRWTFPDARDSGCTDPPQRLAAELRDLLEDAVRIRLRADVAVGSYLSGGIDSSMVAGLARKLHGAGLSTFGIRFPTTEHDEGDFQEAVARHLDVRHEALAWTAGDLARDLPRVVYHAEAPLVRTAPVPLFALSRRLRVKGLKVVLTGEGADEILGGYDLFREAAVRRAIARRPGAWWVPRLVARLYPWQPAARPRPGLAAALAVGLDRPHNPLFSHLPRIQAGLVARRLLAADWAAAAQWDPSELEAELPPGFDRWHPLSRAQYLEATVLLPGNLLSVQGDRMLMAHAVEGRFPFLDPRVIAFAAALPPRLKLKGLREKPLLKAAAASLVPPMVAERPKQPYRAPDLTAVLWRPEGAALRAFLDPAELRAVGVFAPIRVERFLDHLRRAGQATEREAIALSILLTTQIWHRTFAQATAREPVHV